MLTPTLDTYHKAVELLINGKVNQVDLYNRTHGFTDLMVGEAELGDADNNYLYIGSDYVRTVYIWECLKNKLADVDYGRVDFGVEVIQIHTGEHIKSFFFMCIQDVIKNCYPPLQGWLSIKFDKVFVDVIKDDQRKHFDEHPFSGLLLQKWLDEDTDMV